MEPVLMFRWTSHGYYNLKQCYSLSTSQGICARKYSNCCRNKWDIITFLVQTKRTIHLSATKPPSLQWIVVNYQLSETQKKFGDRILTDNYGVVTGNLSSFTVVTESQEVCVANCQHESLPKEVQRHVAPGNGASYPWQQHDFNAKLPAPHSTENRSNQYHIKDTSNQRASYNWTCCWTQKRVRVYLDRDQPRYAAKRRQP